MFYPRGIMSRANGKIYSSIPDAAHIIAVSAAATQRHWQTRLHYTYIQREESWRRDPTGGAKSVEVDVSRMILVNGIPFERQLEHNGLPISPEAERQQNEQIAKLKRETPEQREARFRKLEEENTSIIREVPSAFDFELVGEEVINNRPAYVLQAKPRPGYQAQGKYAKMFSRVEGELWVDKQDLGWVKVEAKVTQPISMGFFVARVQRGSRITMRQVRVDDGLWMPETIEVQAAAKILFVKSLTIEKVLTYSAYQLAETNGSMIRITRFPWIVRNQPAIEYGIDCMQRPALATPTAEIFCQ
jgi:hypothetical protein